MKTQKRDTNGHAQFESITHEKSELPVKFSEMTQDKYSSMYILVLHRMLLGLPWWLSGKRICLQCRRCWSVGSIPRLGRSHGRGNGNPLQYSCLGNAMDRGAWWATVHGVTKSQTHLSD